MRWGISFDELVAVLQIRRGNRDNFGIIIPFYGKNIFCDPSLEPSQRLAETVLMRGHNICFH